MLLKKFSIAVEEPYSDEVDAKLYELGVEVMRCEECLHPIHKTKIVIQYDCIAPIDRVNVLCEYLNKAGYQTILL